MQYEMYGRAFGAVPTVNAYGGRGSMHSGRVYRCNIPAQMYRHEFPPSSEANIPAVRSFSGTSANLPMRPKPVEQ